MSSVLSVKVDVNVKQCWTG